MAGNMNAIFCMAKATGSGASTKDAIRPWFSSVVSDWAGQPFEAGGLTYYCANVFSESQATLDSIVADPKTEITIPIDVNKWDLSFADVDVPPAARGKINALLAQAGYPGLGAKTRRRSVAQHVMEKLSGVSGIDPLTAWRVTNWPKDWD